MAGYIRQSSFSDGDTITAALFNDEYNQLLSAFGNTGGHKHDGTAAEGPVIGLIGDAGETAPNNKVLIDTTNNFIEFYVQVSSSPVQQLYISDGAIIPVTDSDIDLGTTSLRFKDTYTDTITTTGNVSVGGNLTVTGTTTFNGGTITMGDAATDNVVFGADVDSNIIPDDDNTYDLGSSSQQWKDIYIDGVAYLDAIDFNGTTITSTAAELNILDGVTSTAAELNILDGVTSTAAELNILDGVTSTAAELNILDGVTSTAAELNILDGVTSTAAELNILDGVTASATDINLIDGITNGTVIASKAIVTDSNKDITGGRNITISGELDAATLDISGDADIDGTLEADAITIAGVTLAETISDTVGAMVSSNTETNITVTYDDSDNTLDFVLPASLEITTAVGIGGGSTNGVQISQGAIAIKNGGAQSYVDFYCESSNAHYTRIQAAAHSAYSGNVTATLPVTTGTLAITSEIPTTEQIQDIVGAMVSSNTETNVTVTYQDSDGTLDFVVDAAQPNVTSLGTLTSLTVDDITIDSSTISDASDLTIDVGGDIILDADGGDIRFKDGGTEFLQIFNNSTDAHIYNSVQDKDILIQGNDGGSTVTAVQFDMSDAGTAIFNHDITLPDNGKAIFGAGDDLQIYHDGSHSYVQDTGTGSLLLCGTNLALKNGAGTENYLNATENGALYLFYDNAEKLRTESNGVTITGSLAATLSTNAQPNITSLGTLTGLTTTGDINLGDSDKAIFGAGSDLQIYHDGSNSYIQDTGTGNLYIDATSSIIFRDYGSAEEMAKFINDGAVTLYYDNSAKIATTSTGIDVTGTVTATGTSVFASLDISGDVDVDGTLETDALTIGGVTLAETISDTVGAMVTSNTESGITVAYQDADNTLDFTIGTLNQDTTGTAATVTTAAQPNITSLGTLTTLTVDDITINGSTISDGGDLTVDSGGNIVLDADGGGVYFKDGGTTIGFFQNDSSDFRMISSVSDKDIKFLGNDGGSTITALTLDMSNGGQAIFNKGITVNDHVYFGDNDKAVFGGSNDLNVYHDGSNSYIDETGTGILYIRSNDVRLMKADGSETMLQADDDGAVNLYHNNSLKLATTSTGATTTGLHTSTTSANISQVAITSSSNAVAWDARAAANAYHVTTENTTFSAPSNAVEGAIISVELAQGGTARTIAWNTVFEFAASTAPTVTATANKTDIFSFRYNGSVWQEIGRVQNMAQT